MAEILIASAIELMGFENVWLWRMAGRLGAALWFVALKITGSSGAEPPLALARLRWVPLSLAAEVLSGDKAVLPAGASSEQLLHRLLKAVWRGEFEDHLGGSRLFLPKAANRVDGKLVDAAGNIVDDPPKREYDRLSLSMVVKPFEGMPTPRQLREFGGSYAETLALVPLSRLEALSPSDYPQYVVSAYIEPMLMMKRDFLRWFWRYTMGDYEDLALHSS